MSPRLSISDIFLRAQPDERLARLASEGNERAFSTLAERHRRGLVAHAARVVDGGREEDVVQQGLLRAWSALRRGVEVDHPAAWLHRIVHNQALTELGRRGAPTERLTEELADERAASANLEQRLEALSVLAGISALPERQRIALVATEFEGRSRAQIATDLGMSDGAVRQLVHRARAGVRAAVAVVVPWPILLRIIRHEPDAALAHPAAAIAGGGGAAGAGGVALKVGAAALAVGAIGGGVIVHFTHRGPEPAARHARRPSTRIAPGTRVAALTTVLGHGPGAGLAPVAARTGTEAVARATTEGVAPQSPGALHLGSSRHAASTTGGLGGVRRPRGGGTSAPAAGPGEGEGSDAGRSGTPQVSRRGSSGGATSMGDGGASTGDSAASTSDGGASGRPVRSQGGASPAAGADTADTSTTRSGEGASSGEGGASSGSAGMTASGSGASGSAGDGSGPSGSAGDGSGPSGGSDGTAASPTPAVTGSPGE